MPDGTKQFYTGPWILNGAFRFTEDNQRSAWSAGLGTLSPRAGMRFRLTEDTALRVGNGRYSLPHNMNQNAVNQFSAPCMGFADYTDSAWKAATSSTTPTSTTRT